MELLKQVVTSHPKVAAKLDRSRLEEIKTACDEVLRKSAN